MLLVYLDPYHLGDPLFLTQFARDMAHRGDGAILIHGSGEAGERALEATGAVARQLEGVWEVETPEQAAVVERAVRELNRQIVHELNDVGVPAVRLLGADRGLLKQEGGEVVAGSTAWVAELVAQGVVGVLASFVDAGQNELVEVSPIQAAAALALATGAKQVLLLETGANPSRRDADAGLAERLRARNVEATVIRKGDLRSFLTT